MKHVMIDLETIDTKISAGVLSIAAIQFDLRTGRTGKNLLIPIGYNNAVESHGTVSMETVEWWSRQDKEVRDAQMYPLKPLNMTRALAKLTNFINNLSVPADMVQPWGNGSSFDISILEYHYQQEEFPIPWKFYNVRDVRTCCMLGGVRKNHIKFEGNMHDPIDDCLHQIKMVHKAYLRTRT